MSEPLDRNKSDRTHRATAVAATWLDGIGCKPVETEVYVDQGWIADLAAFWSPTRTEMKRVKLHKMIAEWEGPDAIGDPFDYLAGRMATRLTVVAEVKVDAADFKRDIGRKYCMDNRMPTMRAPAHLLLLVGPKSAIGARAPWDWGWLETSECCTRALRWHPSWRFHPQAPGQIEDVIAGVAIRRDHNTRYESLRRVLKSYRAGGQRE